MELQNIPVMHFNRPPANRIKNDTYVFKALYVLYSSPFRCHMRLAESTVNAHVVVCLQFLPDNHHLQTRLSYIREVGVGAAAGMDPPIRTSRHARATSGKLPLMTHHKPRNALITNLQKSFIVACIRIKDKHRLISRAMFEVRFSSKH